jgi:hypothetical protein
MAFARRLLAIAVLPILLAIPTSAKVLAENSLSASLRSDHLGID